MNTVDVELDLDLFDDAAWDNIEDAPTETFRRLYDQLTELLVSLDYQVTQRRAKYDSDVVAQLSHQEHRQLRAEFSRWRASTETLKRVARLRRKRISAIMSDAQKATGISNRHVVYELVKGIYEFVEDPDMDDEHLHDLLDNLNVFASGRTWTLREWYTEGNGRW